MPANLKEPLGVENDTEEWLEWVKDDRETIQDIYFFMDDKMLLGAISIRYNCACIDGHSGFGIRPSERNKGYASRMLSLALPIMKDYGISLVVLSCASVKSIISLWALQLWNM